MAEPSVGVLLGVSAFCFLYPYFGLERHNPWKRLVSSTAFGLVVAISITSVLQASFDQIIPDPNLSLILGAGLSILVAGLFLCCCSSFLPDILRVIVYTLCVVYILVGAIYNVQAINNQEWHLYRPFQAASPLYCTIFAVLVVLRLAGFAFFLRRS